MQRWAALTLAVLLPARVRADFPLAQAHPPARVIESASGGAAALSGPGLALPSLDLAVEPLASGQGLVQDGLSVLGQSEHLPAPASDGILARDGAAADPARRAPRVESVATKLLDASRESASSPSGAESALEHRPEPGSDPLGDARDFAARLAGGAAVAETISWFYSGSGALPLDLAHDFSVLGEPGDSIVRTVVRRAEEAILRQASTPAPSEEGPLLVETQVRKIEPDRIWGWMEGIQRVRRVDLPSWWSGQRERGERPRGWNIEVLEINAEIFNRAMQGIFGQSEILPPTIVLGQVKVLEDAFLSEKENRASVQEWLIENGIPNIRDAGAFNLFDEVVLWMDFLRFRETSEKDIIALIIHELLGIQGLPHKEIVRQVRRVGTRTMKKNERLQGRPPHFSQARLVDLVRRSRIEAAKLALPRPAPPRTPNSGSQKSAASDRYVVPFKPASLQLSRGIGNVEGDQPPRLPFRYAFLRFSTNYGATAIGIYEEFDKSLPGVRHISFWWTNGKRKEDWREIRLVTPEEMADAEIQAQASPQPGAPPPLIELEDFRRDLLEHFDSAVGAFLEDPANSKEAAAFVETVYRSFRENFERVYPGEDLPDFDFARPDRRPPQK